MRHLAGLWKCLVLVLMLGLLSPAFAQEAEYDTNMRQARSFIKKGWYREAIKELRRAISTEQGRESFEAHQLLAQSCFRSYDIGCATHYADQARGLARAPQEKESAENMVEYLTKNFAKVEFRAGQGELNEGYLELKVLDPILDKEIKAYYKEKVEPLRDQRRTVPWIMYLPANTYELYGKEFTIEGGKEQVVEAGFTAENSVPRPEKVKPPPSFEGVGVALQGRVGAGFSALNGSSLNFGPVLDVSIHKTLGDSLSAGAFVKLNRFAFDASASDVPAAYLTSTYGVIGSYSLGLTRDLRLVPALGYGFGGGPAQRFTDCVVSAEEGGEVYQCGGGAGTGLATVNSMVHGPLGRLGVAYRRQSTKLIMSGGVDLQAHYGLLNTGVPDGSGFTIQIAEGALARPLRVEVLAGVNMTF